ncbi:hypothetical protein Acr_00g0087080 [Actinidia rufa]|uniref:Uncharacterized protein n=1 Tax=Actinidia rufa TaxID=165716 RepID=A0A7J0DVW6_9ERIC|nr:hypothetical protein Acr_00g0087080 [Actinidia rufa]
MESDDDYDSFSPPEQSSPPIHHPKLKRLKKSILVMISEEEETSETLRSQLINEGFDAEIDLDSRSDGLQFSEDREEFDGKRSDPSGVEDLQTERSEKKQSNAECSDEKKEKKKKKRVNSGGDETNPKGSSSVGKTEEKKAILVFNDSLKPQPLESPESQSTLEGFEFVWQTYGVFLRSFAFQLRKSNH